MTALPVRFALALLLLTLVATVACEEVSPGDPRDSGISDDLDATVQPLPDGALPDAQKELDAADDGALHLPGYDYLGCKPGSPGCNCEIGICCPSSLVLCEWGCGERDIWLKCDYGCAEIETNCDGRKFVVEGADAGGP